MGRKVDDTDIKLALKMVERGIPKSDVAQIMGVDKSLITRWCQKKKAVLSEQRKEKRIFRSTVVMPGSTKKALKDCADFIENRTKIRPSESSLMLHFIKAGVSDWELHKTEVLSCLAPADETI